MNKSKLIIYVAVVLIFINSALLAFNFFKPHNKNHKQKGGPKEMIIKKLDFNTDQTKEYELLIQEHRKGILNLEKEQRNIKTALYSTIVNSEITRDSLLSEIGKKQIEIELVHIKHFEDIKNICSEDQLPAFENLMSEIGNIFGQTHPKIGQHPRD